MDCFLIIHTYLYLEAHRGSENLHFQCHQKMHRFYIFKYSNLAGKRELWFFYPSFRMNEWVDLFFWELSCMLVLKYLLPVIWLSVYLYRNNEQVRMCLTFIGPCVISSMFEGLTYLGLKEKKNYFVGGKIHTTDLLHTSLEQRTLVIFLQWHQ